MRRGDDRHAARHRLEHGNPEAFEERRVDEYGRASVEARELLVVDVAEADYSRPVESRLRPPPAGPDDRERQTIAAQLARVEQRLEVLPRLQRRNRQHVRPAQARALALARKDRRGRRMGHVDPRGLDIEQLLHLTRSERGVADDQVSGARSVTVLRGMHANGASVRPFGKPQGHEVVNRRCAHACALRRVHPIGEVEDVEAPEPPLSRRALQPRPGSSPRVRKRQHEQAPLHVDAAERLFDGSLSADGHRSEGDDVCADFDESSQRAEHVVADPGARVRQRRNVERDSHLAGTYSKLTK